MSEKRAQKFHTDDVSLPILITASVRWGRGGGWAVRGDSHIKVTRILLLKLMGVNCSFGTQDRKLTFLCIQISLWVVYKKNIITFRHTVLKTAFNFNTFQVIYSCQSVSVIACVVGV